MDPQKTEARPVRPVQDATRPGAEVSPEPKPSGPVLERLSEIFRDFDSVRALLRRQQRVMALAAVVVAALLGIALAMQTPLFESTALLLVKFGRELVYQPQVGDTQAFSQRDKQAVLNSEVAILLSQPVMENVVRDVGLATLYPDLAERLAGLGATPEDPAARAEIESPIYVEAASRLMQSLTAQALPEAHVIRIAYRHPDPEVAADTVNAAVDRFTEKHLEAFAEPELVNFLTARVEEFRTRLDESEQALRDFETEHRAFALEDPQGTLLRRREEVRRELAELDREIANLRRGDLQEASAVSEARRELLALELEQSRLKGKLRDDVTQRIGVVKRFIRERQAEREAQVRLMDQSRSELEEELFQVESDLTSVPRLATRYRELRRERDANEEQYRTYAKRLRDARLSHEMDREKLASINVIQPAYAAPAPIWPSGYLISSAVIAVVAIIAGLLAGTLVDSLGVRLPVWLQPSEGPSGRR